MQKTTARSKGRRAFEIVLLLGPLKHSTVDGAPKLVKGSEPQSRDGYLLPRMQFFYYLPQLLQISENQVKKI
jgi:hypothetical protein